MYKNGIFISEFMNRIWNDTRLTAEDKCVLIYLIEHQSTSIPTIHGNIFFLESYLSYEELSEKCCISIESVNEVVTRLRKHNYLTIAVNSSIKENNNVSGKKTKIFLLDPNKINELSTYERKLNYFERLITEEYREFSYLIYFIAGGYHITHDSHQNTKLIIDSIRIKYMNITTSNDYWVLTKDNPEELEDYPFNSPEMTKNYKWDYILRKRILFIEHLPVYLQKPDYYKFWVSVKARLEEKETITVILSTCITEEDFIRKYCNVYVKRRELKDEFKETLEQVVRDVWKNMTLIKGYEDFI